eukprot:8484148-Lingulodinium_polyedra.AAC.1
MDSCGIQWHPVESNGLHLAPVDPIGLPWPPMGSFELSGTRWGHYTPLGAVQTVWFLFGSNRNHPA